MLIILSLIATRVFWNGAFPYTHDGENHLARFANYFVALREGQFPPRFAPHLFAGYGFPVFQYNYPLANIFAVPFMALKWNPESVYATQAFASTFILGSAWFFFLRRRFGESASWLGVIAILFSSVIQSNFFYRGNIGELWAVALVSLWFLAWDKREKYRPVFQTVILSSILACFLLSHNVIAIFLSPFLLIWQGITSKDKKDLWAAVLSWVISFGLVAWFWIPAVFELSLVVLSNDSLALEASRHTLSLGQIFLSPLRFGFSRPGPLDNLGWGWGAPVIILLWLGIGQLFRTRPNLNREWNIEKRTAVFFTTLFILGCIMSSSLTTFVWRSAPILPLMQFPWRWLSFSLLAVPYLSALIFTRSGNHGRKLIVFAFIIWFFMLARMTPADRFHKETLSYRVFPHTSLTRNEDRPKTLTSESLIGWEPGPQILEGEASDISIRTWNGSVHEYSIVPKTDVLVLEKTVYFPGWETRLNGESLEQVFSEKTGGLIAYRVPAQGSEVVVKTSFTHRTMVRLISELVFVVTFISVLALLAWDHFAKRRRV